MEPSDEEHLRGLTNNIKASVSSHSLAALSPVKVACGPSGRTLMPEKAVGLDRTLTASLIRKVHIKYILCS